MTIEEQRELQGRLQNLSTELGTAEAEFAHLSVKIRPNSTRETQHEVMIQALDRISRLRERLKNEEGIIGRELSRL